MERVLWKTFLLLMFSLVSKCGGISDEAAGKPRTQHLFVQRSQPLPGSAKKLLKIEYEEPFRSNAEEKKPEFLRRVRRSVDPDMNPVAHVFRFNDSHNWAFVHWAGDHRDTIVVLTRDPRPNEHSNSHVWISRNYGQSFVNRTGSFRTLNKGFARIDMFYPSPLDRTRYLFVDRQHKMIYSSIDDCQTIVNSSVAFVANEITFHSTRSDVVLAYDASAKKLYYSADFGFSWNLKDENVLSYFWGILPWDNPNTLYIEREEITGGYSNVVKTDYFSHFSALLITKVEDFEVIDNYMFATQVNTSSGHRVLTLMVSVNRSDFHPAVIPTDAPSQDFYVADASENQVFLAVTHDRRTTHLYISDTSGLKYSLSLQRVLYFSPNTTTAWLRRYIRFSFVDLHKVQGLRGVYIASQLTVGAVGTRHILSKITFDKGGLWQPVSAPKVDNYGKPLNCSLPNCSLHLSQKFGQYYPYTRYSPMRSWSNAPGIIIATGTYGTNLRLNSDIFLSTDAGLNWHMILQRPFWLYNLGDHGGIFIAVRRNTLTNLIYYSWNEGETWLTYRFLNNTRLRVYGLLTEPGEQSAEFTIYGSYAGYHRWVVVQIDLRKALGSACVKKDYKEWIPTDEQSGSCLLGRKMIYERRISHAHCYNGYDYDRPITTQNCACEREDFECDVGYMPAYNDPNKCQFDKSSGLSPTSMPAYCPAGSTWRRTKGYRKVAGDTCSGGMEDQFSAVMVSCRIGPQPQFLLYAARRYIRRITLGDNRETTVPLGRGLQNAIALDYDYAQNCIYWADITLDTIKRSFLNGSGIIETLHGGIRQVEGIALDWLADNIYWIDAVGKKLEVSRADGRFRKVIISSNLDRPRAIVLDPVAGYMYWTDWGTSARIERAYMSGSSRAAIISSRLQWPNGIAIDFTARKLYWTDAGTDRIERSNLDGTYRQVITSRGLPHPYSISVFKDSIYWDDWSTQSIKKANKRDGGARQTIKSGVRGLMDVKVFHEDAQIGNNSCARLKRCSHLCLAVPNSYACACPDNMRTVTSVFGAVTCECQPGEHIDGNGECTAKTGTCAPNEFSCANRRCIPSHWKCDHDNDCGDNSDEQHCPYDTCSSTQFTCDNGRCISASWKCDHDDDCHDNSDEKNCRYPTCGPDKFTCANRRCIPKRWVCDFDNDCRDGSDEQGCTPAPVTTAPPVSCHSSQFACHNGRCIPMNWKCDGDQDCGDGSDEPSSCPSHRTCSPTQFLCTDGRCIPGSWKCDGDNDCGDRSDERGCAYSSTRAPVTTAPWTRPTNCRSWEWRCHNSYCVYQWDVCDGVNDCGDNSDEWFCGTTRPSANTTTSPSRPCHFWEFTCDSGVCINNGYKCNGQDDCGDNSDERGCSAQVTTVAPTTAPATCPDGWLHCGQTQLVICIHHTWLCDGKPNCPQSWDEKPENCPSTTRVPTTCSSNWYQCTNGLCIDRAFVCDGNNQCGDGSDEVGCGSPGSCTGFLCDKTLCLSVSRRCDHIQDCYDGSDEKNCPNSLQVTGVQVSRLSGTSVSVSWRPISYQPAGMTFTGYRVSYRAVVLHSVPVSGSWQQEETPNVNYHVVNSLQPCSEYEFKVQLIVGGVQPGPYSSTVKATTTSAKTSKPQNVQHLLANDDSLRISWDPPAIYCHLITNYEVAYKEDKEVTFYTKETGNVFSLVLNLAQGATYKIKVKAFNGDKGSDGDGDWSEVQTVLIPATFQKPTASVTNARYTFSNDSAVTLAWGSPATSGGITHPVKGYKVYELTTDGLILLVATTQHNYTVYSLFTHTSYSFVIKPYNDAGEGPSASIEVMTTGGDPPTDVKATPLNDTTIKLSWKAPRRHSQGVRYYIFYGRLIDGVSSRPVGSTTTRSYLVNNLQQEIVYVFEVSVGYSGKRSETAVSQTKTDAVHSLRAQLVNSSSVVLTWQKPVDALNVTGYQVKRTYGTTSGGTSSVTQSTKKTIYVFRYLPFDTVITFEVQVKHGDQLGTGITTTKKTNPFTAPVRPLRVRVVNDAAELSWSAPRTISNTDLKHYQVNWTCSSCVKKHDSKLVSKTKCTFQKLEHSRTYNFSVKAMTSKFGSGEASTVTATITDNFGAVGSLSQSLSGNSLTLHWDVPTDVEKGDVKIYQISWCQEEEYYYCWQRNTTNSTGNATRFTMQVLAGYTYSFYVKAYTPYGEGKESTIQVIVPPLNLAVPYGYGRATGGNYGLEVSLQWSRPYRYVDNIQYEVEWHCLSGTGSGYCFWYGWAGWKSIVVNATSALLNMTSYGVTFLFKITPTIPSRGRGKSYTFVVNTPDLTASIGNLTCRAEYLSNGTRLKCQWSQPTGFDISKFYHYDFRYRCDDCLGVHYVYRSIRYINQTSIIIYVDRGQQYTLWNRAHTAYGFGTRAQTTVLIKSKLEPVTSLKAVIDPKEENRVYLSWKAPAHSFIKSYIVVIECLQCASFKKVAIEWEETNYTQILPCGILYKFTVRGVTKDSKRTQESTKTLSLSAPVGKVTNLTVEPKPVKPGDILGGEKECSVIRWGPPQEKESSSAEWNGYEIVVRTTDSLGNILYFTNTSKETQEFTLCVTEHNELQAGKEYFFEVRVTVPCGFGERAILRARFASVLVPNQPPTPSARKQTGNLNKGLNPVIWAVPVAVVGLILVVIMIFFIHKSRRLERSMFALMTRRIIDDDDDEGGVTFHSGEDAPLIQGFSDDEPLVTA